MPMVVCKLLFTNSCAIAARKTYVDLLQSNPRHAISPLDLEISQRCEQLIVAEPTFVDLKGSVGESTAALASTHDCSHHCFAGAFYAMKATLSYHHALKRSKDSLIDVDYMLVMPFVFAAKDRVSRCDSRLCFHVFSTNEVNDVIDRREPAPNHVVAMLVEQFLTFMDSRPGFVVDSGSEVRPSPKLNISKFI